MNTENLDEFLQDHKNFNRKENGIGVDREEDWFYTVQQKHKTIRKKIGGTRNVQLAKLKESMDYISVESGDSTYIINDILYYVPNILKDNKLERSVFYNSKMSDGTKLSKFISTYGRKKKLSYFYMDSLNRCISDLAEVHNESKVHGGKYYVQVDTSAMSFVKLGCYGVDDDSCFGPGGCNEDHKYNIGKCLNTFVVLLSKEPFDKDGESKGITGRAWGYLSGRDGKCFNICNHYLNTNLKTFICAINKAFNQITKSKLNIFQYKCDVPLEIYFNEESDYSFSPAKFLKTQQILTMGRVIRNKKSPQLIDV